MWDDDGILYMHASASNLKLLDAALSLCHSDLLLVIIILFIIVSRILSLGGALTERYDRHWL